MPGYQNSELGPKPVESALVLSYSARLCKHASPAFVRTLLFLPQQSWDFSSPYFERRRRTLPVCGVAPLDAAGEAVAAPQRSEVEHPAGN